MTVTDPAVVLVMITRRDLIIWRFIPLAATRHHRFKTQDSLENDLVSNCSHGLEIHPFELWISLQLRLNTLVVLCREILGHFCYQAFNPCKPRDILIRSTFNSIDEEFVIFLAHSRVAGQVDWQDASGSPQASAKLTNDKAAESRTCDIHME